MKFKRLISLAIITFLLNCCSSDPNGIPVYISEIFTCNSDGTNINNLFQSYTHRLSFIPQMDSILYLIDNSIYIYDIENDVHTKISKELYVVIDTPPKIDNQANFICFSAKTNQQGDIYIYEIDSETIINLTNTPEISEYYPDISSNANKIVYIQEETSSENDRLCIYDINTSLIDTLISVNDNEGILNPIISQDENYIFYQFLYNRESGIIKYDLSDGSEEQITNYITISHNYLSESSLGYLCYLDGNNIVHVYDYNNNIDIPIAEGYYPCISSNALKVVYGTNSIYQSGQVKIYDIETNNTLQIDVQYGGNPNITYDGNRIVFSGYYLYEE